MSQYSWGYERVGLKPTTLYMTMNNKVTITVDIQSVTKDVTERDMSDIPNSCGAYVIKVKSGKQYIGSSKTLRARISQHNHKLDPNISTSDKIISTCYYVTNSHVDARIVENWLIREINPELNKTNRHDNSKMECGARCFLNCESWESFSESIEFDVNILETCKDISGEKLSELPRKTGVYVITTISDKIYVGSSSNVFSRLKEHNSLEGPNVTEPIKLVCCYITENRTDAYILEYSKIRELSPSLNKEFQVDAWKWEAVELRAHFDKSTPELVKLFRYLSKCILSGLPGIEEVGRKNRITYRLKNKHIFFVKFMNGYLQVDLKDKYCNDENNKIIGPQDFLKSIKPTASDIFHWRFRLIEISEIDKAMDILKQAYKGVLK
jgi:predicted GIY-YIG superfamily endonuclease